MPIDLLWKQYITAKYIVWKKNMIDHKKHTRHTKQAETKLPENKEKLFYYKQVQLLYFVSFHIS